MLPLISQHFCFQTLNQFSSLSTHRTEMKQCDSEIGRRPRWPEVETLLNLYQYIYLKKRYIYKKCIN